MRDYVDHRGKTTPFSCPIDRKPVGIEERCHRNCDFEAYNYEPCSDGRTHAILICALAHDENELVSGKPTRFP